MRWHHLLQSVMVCLALWCVPAQARQSGPLIADLIEYRDVRAVVPASTADAFSRSMVATADQKTAATLLVEGARAEVARIVNRHLRTVRDDPTLQEIRESEADVVRKARAVEQKLLADLQSLLTPTQAPQFARFERAHRRSLLSRAAPQPMPVDLWRFFAANNFEPSKDEAITALLEKFDRESDAALVRDRLAVRAYFANVRLGFDGSEESTQRDRKAQKELYAARANLERVLAAVVEPLATALPSELADKFLVRITELATADFDRNLIGPDRYPIIREVLSLELTPSQRSSVQAIVDAARTEARTQARFTAIEQARHILLDDKTRTDGRTSPLNLYLESAGKLRTKVSNEALALLTPTQREAYDASAVIDPSATSTVADD
ncbi:MAG: Spy/CpxP family protein refolding chaperone [Planctomycetota bacterium]|nr:Spy/CpxP family protein refolding chaperone [Planctomycetota bacterium]